MASSAMASRRIWLTGALAVIIITIVLSRESWQDQAQETLKQLTNAELPFWRTASSGSRPTWASYEDYLRGSWVYIPSDLSPQERVDIEYPDNVYNNYIPELYNWETLGHQLDYKWFPERGELRPWDSMKMAVRLLQSPAGVVMVGDSLTRQTFEGFTNMFGIRSDLFKYQDETYSPTTLAPILMTMKLDLEHPKAQELIELAGVSMERAERPIVTFYRNDELLDEDIFNEIWKELDLPLGPDNKSTFESDASYTWISEFRETLTRPPPSHGARYPENYQKRDTILILNTGAHWQAGHFGIEMNDVWRLYEAVKDKTISLVDGMPNAGDIQLFYRPTSPGHTECRFYTHPMHLQEAQLRFAKGGWYNYDEFPRMNQIWEDALRDHPLESKRMFLEVYDQALIRPDAHRIPNDCLHWVAPSVPEEWVKLITHLIREDEGDSPLPDIPGSDSIIVKEHLNKKRKSKRKL